MPKGLYSRKPMSEQHKRNISKANKGEKGNNWKGGLRTNNRKEYNKIWHQKRRKLVLEFYSGSPSKCACCGESEIKFLAIDHIDGGGAAQRSTIKGGSGGMLTWIIKNDFPNGLQVLCHNCNQAKGWYGKCPHQLS